MSLITTARGASSTNTGGQSTLVINPASNIAAGSRVIVCFAYDNSGASGVDPFSGIVDSQGNNYVSEGAQNSTLGVANDGVSLRMYSAPVGPNGLLTTDTITISFGGITTVARAWALWEISSDVTGYQAKRSNAVGAQGNTATPSITTALAAVGTVVVGVVAWGYGTALTLAADIDTSGGTWSAAQSSKIGTTTAGVSVISQYKSVTGAGTKTYNPTNGGTVARDGIIAATFTGTLITVSSTKNINAVILKTQATTNSLDAIIEREQTATKALDAVILKTQLPTAPLNAVIFKTQLPTKSLDAVIRRGQSATGSLDAIVLRPQTSTRSLDAIVLRTQLSTTSLGAVILRAMGGSRSLDAIVQTPRAASSSLDAILQAGRSGTPTLDAILLARQSGSPTLNAILRAGIVRSHHLDAIIRRVYGRTRTLDAVLRVERDLGLSLSAVIRSTRSPTTSLSSVIRANRQSAVSLSAWISGGAYTWEAAVSLDALIMRRSTSSLSLGSWLLRQSHQSLSLNAILTRTDLRQMGLGATLRRPFDSTFSLESLVSRPSIRNVPLSAVLLRTGLRSVALDAIITVIRTTKFIVVDGTSMFSSAALGGHIFSSQEIDDISMFEALLEGGPSTSEGIWVQGDTEPAIVATLVADGEPLPLEDSQVFFQMRLPSHHRFTVDALADVTDRAAARVTYRWGANDLSVAGEYQAQWKVIFSDGRRQTTAHPVKIIVRRA